VDLLRAFTIGVVVVCHWALAGPALAERPARHVEPDRRRAPGLTGHLAASGHAEVTLLAGTGGMPTCAADGCHFSRGRHATFPARHHAERVRPALSVLLRFVDRLGAAVAELADRAVVT
jgi:hypothetical protein